VGLSFELELQERRPDRVLVSVFLQPGSAEGVTLDGVALDLCNRHRETVGPRLLLPIAGRLAGPLVTQAELRALEPIPEGAVVVGTAWWGSEQVQASIPADPGTDLAMHVRGEGAIRPADREVLLSLSPRERIRLEAAFPWLCASTGRCEQVKQAILEGQLGPNPEEVDAFARDLGLGEECTAWLKDLLAEE
jgi:hypothetical protein